jgi:hypothetical protein
MKIEKQTVYIVDDHNLVGDPSLEWYTVDEFKKCIDYFERLYWTKDSRYQQQSIRVFWDYKEASAYHEKLKDIWETKHRNRESA